MIKAFIKTFDVKADLKFNDTYLVGKLINILGDRRKIRKRLFPLCLCCLQISIFQLSLVEGTSGNLLTITPSINKSISKKSTPDDFKIGLRNNVKTLFLMLIIDRDERVIWLKE